MGKLTVKNDIKNDKRSYAVQAHGHPIDVPLADEASIKVDFADFSQADIGDNITVSGMGTHPKVLMSYKGEKAALGMVQASDVKIEMAEQLKGKPKGSAAKTTSHPKKDKEDTIAVGGRIFRPENGNGRGPIFGGL